MSSIELKQQTIGKSFFTLFIPCFLIGSATGIVARMAWDKIKRKKEKKIREELLLLEEGAYYSQIIFLKGFIDIEMEMSFARQYNKLKDHDLHIVLNCEGGLFDIASRIGALILAHKKKTRCTIIFNANSGGLLIALCCEEINILTEEGVVSPCDLMINSGNSDYSYREYKKKIENNTEKKINESDMKLYSRMLGISAQYDLMFEMICKRSKAIIDREKVYQRFFSGNFNHQQMMNIDEAEQNGLKINRSDSNLFL